MIHFYRLGLALLFVLCVNWAHGELRDVVIMQTTDMHGVFEDEDDDGPSPGSWLRIATMVKRIRQREEGKCILVDCGVSYRTLKRHLPARLSGILVTHSHTDHVSGLRTLLQHVDAPVFANALTAEATAWQEKLSPEAFALFENGQTFEVGPFAVAPFSIPHDTSDPVGFLVRADGLVYFHATDVGTPLDSIGLKLAEADVAEARRGRRRDAGVEPRRGDAAHEPASAQPHPAHRRSARPSVQRPGGRPRAALRVPSAEGAGARAPLARVQRPASRRGRDEGDAPRHGPRRRRAQGPLARRNRRNLGRRAFALSLARARACP